MQITRRHSIIGVFGLLVAMTLLSAVSLLLSPTYEQSTTLAIISVAVALGSIGLLIAYLRGFEAARYIVVVVITLLTGLAAPEEFVVQTATITFFIPAVIALILAEPAWVLGASAGTWLLLLMRAQWQGVYLNPITLLIYGLTVGGIFLAHLVIESAQRSAARSVEEIAQQNARLTQQSDAMAAMNAELQAQNEQQGRLLDLVAQLETPTVHVAEGVLLAPIVGHIDTRRAQVFTANLLAQASASNARLMILDVAGVPELDTTVAGALLNTTRALRLLGCDVQISGISSGVAMTMLQLGVNLSDIRSVRTPQEAIALYERQVAP